jgi:uncharacterized protein YbdZ (MbtH family)
MTGSAAEHWKVVVNVEEQYSIWFADRTAPEGRNQVVMATHCSPISR